MKIKQCQVNFVLVLYKTCAISLICSKKRYKLIDMPTYYVTTR